MITPTIIRRFTTATILTAGTLCGTPISAGGEPAPDLIPVTILGPQITNVGTNVTVHISVANLGGALPGNYTANVLIGKGVSPSEDDVVVATITTPIISSHALLASIPTTLDAGTYHWSLRLVDVDGEVNVGNNVLVGLATSVIKIDLAVLNPAPIEVFARPTDPLPAPIEVIVQNLGSLGSILIYQTTKTPPASWLTIDPPENFAFAGGTPTPNKLIINQTGLPTGTYSTTVRFQNVSDPDDFEEVSVTLTVGDAKFVPGDKLQGQISSSGETDEILFDALAGMKLRFSVKSQTGDLKPVITIIDPDGGVAHVLKFPHSGKAKKKTIKLKTSGEHRLVISGKKINQAGNFEVKTARKLPKKAKTYVAKVAAGQWAKVLAFGGATLNITCSSKGTIFLLNLPSGQTLDATGQAVINGGTVVIEQLPLPATGLYGLVVDGFESGKVKVQLSPSQPPVGTSVIYLP